ncbi:acyl-CoA dehydrogenase family protein [Gordonia soli]|uniref:Putative acyl-CoA dehydrogenase n=1 Tax=Gordonia soli NBRC 108243 TaxID=1223545 RepID=M0QCQ0_9ACTN|nr:acyl-CoA dehydrogenase family protein [Gordonia soli]GAC66214.1 putative acyl-CoA dehydrogenase [Gordonia soli NBRC 108243]
MTTLLDAVDVDATVAALERRFAASSPEVTGDAACDRISAIEETTEGTARRLGSAQAVQRALFDAGLANPSGPPELGGRGLDSGAAHRVREMVASADLPDRAMLFVGLHIVGAAIARHGSDDLVDLVLPGLYRGDTVGCQLFSEPGAGSDLASVSTRARRDGDHWVVRGQKVWTSHAHVADWGEALVRTDSVDDGGTGGSDPAGKHTRLTMLLVDMHAPGVTVRPLRQMTGSAAFNEVFLDDVVVPDTHRIGEVGGGWAIARTSLSAERAMMGTLEGPLTRRVVDRIVGLVDDNHAADEPALRAPIARMVAAVAAVDALSEREPDDWDPSIRAVAGPVHKLLMTEALDAIADLAIAILGSRAVADDGAPDGFAWSEFVLSTPGLHLAGGTDEIQRSMIAQRGLGLPRDREPG